MAGAEAVDVLPCWRVVCIVRPALGFCRKRQKGDAMSAGPAARLAAVTTTPWPCHVLYTHGCRAKSLGELLQAGHVQWPSASTQQRSLQEP